MTSGDQHAEHHVAGPRAASGEQPDWSFRMSGMSVTVCRAALRWRWLQLAGIAIAVASVATVVLASEAMHQRSRASWRSVDAVVVERFAVVDETLRYPTPGSEQSVPWVRLRFQLDGGNTSERAIPLGDRTAQRRCGAAAHADPELLDAGGCVEVLAVLVDPASGDIEHPEDPPFTALGWLLATPVAMWGTAMTAVRWRGDRARRQDAATEERVDVDGVVTWASDDKAMGCVPSGLLRAALDAAIDVDLFVRFAGRADGLHVPLYRGLDRLALLDPAVPRPGQVTATLLGAPDDGRVAVAVIDGWALLPVDRAWTAPPPSPVNEMPGERTALAAAIAIQLLWLLGALAIAGVAVVLADEGMSWWWTSAVVAALVLGLRGGRGLFVLARASALRATVTKSLSVQG